MVRLSQSTRALLSWLPAVAYTCLIWWLSSRTLDAEFMLRVPFQDKGVHFLEYGALCWFIAFGTAVTWPARLATGPLVALLATTALGLLDELHQGFVPGRFSDVGDLAADAIGAATAAVSFAIVAFAYRRLRARRAPELSPP